ncbi:MAG: hypothetical protein EOP45_03110 [Sphingobacteriaceae bacterium]|nr:MAG: hypothetical protein EOP45_03110 [Sphingobacteriaceae bacterium]
MPPVIDRPRKHINRNMMQLMVRMAKQPVKIVEAGRGAGKSTVLADEIADVVHDMPRSTNFLQGATFQQILTRTLPSTILSLETLGYIKDLHYFVGRKPPKSWGWKEAYEPPLDYNRAIYFYNGSTYLLLSQDTSSRGLNTASGIADEFALLDPVKFQSETLATLRSQKARFEYNRRYRNQTYVTSIPRTQEGKFVYKFEEEAKLTPEKILYLRASSKINAANLPAEWFADQKRIMTPYEYNVEIENIRPRALKGGFYPLFNEKQHTYTAFNNDFLSGLVDDGYVVGKFKEMDCRQDSDYYPNAPLCISLDYGQFSCIVTLQETMNMARFISGMSAESPEMVSDLVERWCKYYRFHHDKTVEYHYDQTAMGTDGRSPKSYSEIVIETLIANGWEVITRYYGRNPSHKDKYNFWAIALRNDHHALPHFSWNKHNCKYPIESIQNAGAKEGTNGIEKIKVDEKNNALDQRYTTHYSDAVDMIAYYKYAHLLKETTIWMPTYTR